MIKSILIVDDDDAIRELADDFFGIKDYTFRKTLEEISFLTLKALTKLY